MVESYKVIEGYDSSINGAINSMRRKMWNYLDDGWELQGGIEIIKEGSFYNAYQVVIKNKK